MQYKEEYHFLDKNSKKIDLSLLLMYGRSIRLKRVGFNI